MVKKVTVNGCVGKRLLVRVPSRWVTDVMEVKILEISPSGTYTLVAPSKFSKDWVHTGDIEILEVLPDTVGE